MSFLNPLFLIALVSIGIPLLIYLLNIRKPKRIRFSTLAFFESLKSSSLRKIKIKRWLLLALRTLAVAALAFALAKPFLPSGLGVMADGQPTIIGIVVDNSPGMGQIDRFGPYDEQARELASEIIALRSSDDRFVLNVTNGEPLTLPYLSRAAASREVSEIESSKKGNNIAANLERTIRQLENAPEPNKILYLITDGQESQLEKIRELERDERFDVRINVIKLGEAEPANVGISDVNIVRSDRELLMRAVVQNYGTQPTGSQFFSFFIDDELIAQKPYDIEAGSSRDFQFEIPESSERFLKAELRIEGDELTFDNRYFAAIQLPEQRRVLVVNDPSARSRDFRSYLRPLLDAATSEDDRLAVEYESVDDLSPSQLEGMDAIVLDGLRTIPDYLSQAVIENVQAGAGLLLLPAADGSIESYNRLLGISDAGRYSDPLGSYGSFNRVDQLAEPQQGHPILEAMFDVQEDEELRVNLPELFYYYRINTSGGRASGPVLTSRAGNVILNETVVGNGRLIYSAIGSDPGWSNFPIKPLFAPIFFRTVDYLASGEGAVLNNHFLGEPFEVTIPGASSGAVELIVDDEPIMPATRQTFSGLNLFYEGAEWEPGWVYVNHNDEKKLHAVNLDAMESTLISLDEETISEILSSVFSNYSVTSLNGDRDLFIENLETASFGHEIWYWFIIAAIFLLLTESMVSRHYKAETIT